MVAMYNYNPFVDSPNQTPNLELMFKKGQVITVYGDMVSISTKLPSCNLLSGTGMCVALPIKNLTESWWILLWGSWRTLWIGTFQLCAGNWNGREKKGMHASKECLFESPCHLSLTIFPPTGGKHKRFHSISTDGHTHESWAVSNNHSVCVYASHLPSSTSSPMWPVSPIFPLP